MTFNRKVLDIFQKVILYFVLINILFYPIIFIHGIISVLSGLDLNIIESSTMLDLTITRFAMIAQSAITILSIHIIAKRDKRPRIWSFNWDKQEAIKQGLDGCLWGVVTIGISFFLIWLTGGIQIESFGWEQSLTAIPSWIIMWAGVAISEEYVCRGYFHGLLKEYFGLTTAIVVGSILFALMHSFNSNIFESPIPLLNLFLAGVFYAIAKEVSGSLWLPTGMHFTWNLVQGNILGFGVSGFIMESTLIKIVPQGSKYISGGLFGAEGSVLTIFVQIIAMVGLFLWYTKRTDRPRNSEITT